MDVLESFVLPFSCIAPFLGQVFRHGLEPLLFAAGMTPLLLLWAWTGGHGGAKWNAMQAQRKGFRTRFGVFVTEEVLILRTWQNLTVMTRSDIGDVRDFTLSRIANGQQLLFGLPRQLLRSDVYDMLSAVHRFVESPAPAS